MTTEQRNFADPVSFETRSDGTQIISGYAAVYYDAGDEGTEFQLSDTVVERMRPGAFDDVPGSGVIATFNHNLDSPLGREPDTLTLSVDKRGLRYEISLPPTTVGRDLGISVARRDVRGSSITMRPKVEFRNEDDVLIREIVSARVVELGPVTNPAYLATTAEARSLALEAETWSRQQKALAAVAKLDK